jgi:hypothetical protein
MHGLKIKPLVGWTLPFAMRAMDFERERRDHEELMDLNRSYRRSPGDCGIKIEVRTSTCCWNYIAGPFSGIRIEKIASFKRPSVTLTSRLIRFDVGFLPEADVQHQGDRQQRARTKSPPGRPSR